MLGQDRVDPQLGGGVGSTGERQRDRTETELEQPVPAGGLEVVVPLGRRATDQFDLARVQSEPLIGGA